MQYSGLPSYGAAARRRLVAAGALLALALALAGCGGEEPAPATIRTFTEPTGTVDTSVAPVVEEATGSISAQERLDMEAKVELLSVGFAADGAYLIVNFKAPPRLAIHWQPGQLYVVDEASGGKYDEIPFMPKIGFLIARPQEEGQSGYVMLQNQPPLAPGSKVTVVLGGFKVEHAIVESTNAAAP